MHAARLWYDAMRRILAGDRRQLGIWLRHLIAVSTVLAWVGLICGMPAWVYLLGVAYPSVSLILLRSFAEHRAAPDAAERTVIVEAGPLLRLLYLGNNYQVLHHRRPDLPWYEIGRRYRAEREALLTSNGGYVFPGYGAICRRYLLRAKEHPVHPFGPVEAAER